MDTLKHQIKEWEREFFRVHNRKPSSSDVRKEAHISALYREYQALKGKRKVHPKQKETRPVPDSPETRPSSIQSAPAPNAELGPTPQANGKVLSILDYHMTPPDSSPLKKANEKAPDASQILSTPIKSSAPDFKTPRKARSITAQLQELASPQKPPETPRYLTRSPRSTPVKQPVAFSVSPSPLKTHRFLTRLTDVYNEAHAEPLDDYVFSGSEHELESDHEVEENPFTRKRKYTQKRTTRRWKIKPREGPDEADSFGTKNVREEIARLREEKVEEENEDVSSDDGLPYKPKVVEGKGRAPISQNYQRSRINDPRKKAFLRRVRR